MKKTFFKVTILALSMALLAGCLSACTFIKGLINRNNSFSLSDDSATIAVGEVYQVMTSDGKTAGFTLTSSSPEKVEVDGTTIRGVAFTGTSTVTVTAEMDGKSDTISVSVVYAQITSLTIETSEAPAIQVEGEAQRIVFTAVTNAGADPNTLFSWTVTDKSTGGSVGTGTGKSVAFTPTVEGRVYSVTVSTGGLTATTECGIFAGPYISADKEKYTIDDDDVILNLVFLQPTGQEAEFDIYINGVLADTRQVELTAVATAATAQLNLGKLNALGDYTVQVELNGVRSNTITISAVNLVAANRITVSTADKQALLQKGTASAVTFTAVLYPENSDHSQIIWYVNGTQRGAGSQFTFTPTSHGEFRVTASAGYASSGGYEVVYQAAGSEIWNYTDTLTEYGGAPQNRYITSQEEMTEVILYALENQLYSLNDSPLVLYIAYNYPLSFEDKMNAARSAMPESGMIPGYSYTLSGAVARLNFNYQLSNGDAFNNSPTHDAPDISGNTYTQSSDSPPCYTEGESTRSFFIDSSQKTMDVSTSNMLYKAVSWGYKPVFKGVNAQTLQTIYSNAKTVLSQIITNGMSDYEKVHAIYDWIIYNVRYDNDVAYASTTSPDVNVDLNNKMLYNGYYLEGVFSDMTDPHAVCDGKSKAFVLLCGIEGITSLRVVGEAVQGGSSTGHAWNKVLLDPDGDGKNEWYVVDTTWGDVGSSQSLSETLTHAYFLITDADIADTHVESESLTYPAATTVFDYYSESFEYGGTTYTRVLTSPLTARTQLSALMNFNRLKGLNYLEFRLSYNLTSVGLENLISEALRNAGYSGVKSYSYQIILDDVVCVRIV